MFSRFRHLPLVRQAEGTECGHACLAMIAGWFGHRIDLVSLRMSHATSANGLSVHSMAHLAEQIGLKARALRLEPQYLAQLKMPAVLHWDMNHFVVLKSVGRRTIVVHDPARGVLRLTPGEVADHFTGIAVEFSPAENFKPIRRERRLPLSRLLSGAGAMVRQGIQIVLLSLFMEALLLVAPWYMQIAIDDVIPRGDTRVLWLLAGAFAVVALFRLVTEVARAMLLVYIQSQLDLSMVSRLFSHMVRLPLSFFVKRDDGDIISRFHSLDPIRHVLAEGMLLSLIDGVLAVATLVLMFVVSWPLALVALASLGIYAVLRICFYAPLYARGEDVVRAEANYMTHLIESIRSVQAIKLFNAEAARESQFITRVAEAVHGRARQERLTGLFVALRETVIMLEQVAFVSVGAYLALNGRITIGVLFAILAYKTQFMTAGVHIIEKLIALRLLRLHLDRVSDIAVTDPEAAYEVPLADRGPIEGRLEVSRVGYRYSQAEPFVLADLSLQVDAGESVAITGPSGCGKTTLIKVMLGLFEPTEGEVRVDGLAIPTFGVRAYRRQVATVMQDDQLMTGTILQSTCRPCHGHYPPLPSTLPSFP
jgi:ATP-binding cassette subfamily B protein RaxB